jgi:hypothetical protein
MAATTAAAPAAPAADGATTTTTKKLYTLADLKAHATETSCWILVHGRVYDVTAFLEEHPGGFDIIISNTGAFFFLFSLFFGFMRAFLAGLRALVPGARWRVGAGGGVREGRLDRSGSRDGKENARRARVRIQPSPHRLQPSAPPARSCRWVGRLSAHWPGGRAGPGSLVRCAVLSASGRRRRRRSQARPPRILVPAAAAGAPTR